MKALKTGKTDLAIVKNKSPKEVKENGSNNKKRKHAV
jgi:hypothetical protein